MLTQEDRKIVNKILSSIQRAARLGLSGYRDFESAIKDALDKRRIDLLYVCADTFFDVDYNKFPALPQFKDALWRAAVSSAKLPFLERLKDALDKKGAYLVGGEIRDSLNRDFSFDISPTLDSGMQVVATASKIGMSYSQGAIRINVLDPKIFEIRVSNTTWATYSATPRDTGLIQKIESGVRYETLTFTGSTTNRPISDMQSTVNQVAATGELAGINRIDLSVDIEHSFTGDLQINLKSPNGRVINAKRQGGKQDSGNNMNVTFTSAEGYGRLIRTKADDTTGTWAMDKFIGIGAGAYVSDTGDVRKMLDSGAVTGTWSLYVSDVGVGGTGSLNGWRLDIGASRMNDYLTASQYPLDIPTTQGGTYLVEVTKRNPYGKFHYRVAVGKDDLLGTVQEIDFTTTVDKNYYLRSKRVMEALGIKKYYLEVRPRGGDVVTMMGEDDSLSEEANLIERYRQAVDYLRDQSKLSQTVPVIAFVDDYPDRPNTLDRYIHSTDGLMEWSGDRWNYHTQHVGMKARTGTGATKTFDGTAWID